MNKGIILLIGALLTLGAMFLYEESDATNYDKITPEPPEPKPDAKKLADEILKPDEKTEK